MIQDVEAELFADADPFQANDDAPAANHRYEDDGGELNAENPDDDGVDENAQATKRKRSLKPRPKLDVDRLCGPRGIATLPKILAKTEFKGVGHEVHDLRQLMTDLEHWAHRLMPSMSFDDVLQRCEVLGSKKPAQAYINKIRLDMPLTDEDFSSKDIGDGADEIERNQADNSLDGSEKENGYSHNMNNMLNTTDIDQSFDISSHPKSPSFTDVNSSPKQSQPLSSLTDEQRQRMEMQRQKALELRRQREAKNTEQTTVTSKEDTTEDISNTMSLTMDATNEPCID